MDNRKIDARGLSCPQPALLTHQALNSVSDGTIEVLVDSATARDNVVRTAEKAGWQAKVDDLSDGEFQVSIRK